jgi:hypothetical protein
VDGKLEDDDKPVTGDACVSALIRAGFQVRHRGNGLALLARAGSIVMVPDVGVLEPHMLGAILRSANITKTELDVHLANVPSRSGFFMKASSDSYPGIPTNGARRR